MKNSNIIITGKNKMLFIDYLQINICNNNERKNSQN